MRAERDDLGFVGQVVRHDAGCDIRHDDLTAVRDAHQPGRPIGRRAVIVAAALVRLAGVDSHAHAHRGRARPRFLLDGELRGKCGGNRVGRGGEHGVEAVAGLLHDVATIRLDRVANDGVVMGERVPHRDGRFLP